MNRWPHWFASCEAKLIVPAQLGFPQPLDGRHRLRLHHAHVATPFWYRRHAGRGSHARKFYLSGVCVQGKLTTHHFKGREQLEQTLKRYSYLYNHHIPRRALNHLTPIQAMKDWQQQRPQLFVKNVRNHRGPDSYTTIAQLSWALDA